MFRSRFRGNSSRPQSKNTFAHRLKPEGQTSTQENRPAGGGRNFRSRPPMQKSRRLHGGGGGRGRRGSPGTIDVSRLINKVNDEAFIKPTEHVIEHQFDDFQMDPRLKANIKQRGYISPTPIQDQAIPVGLQGRDVIGIANTGTGKTAAFLVPLINKMLDDRAQKAIILAPTRELATQIHEELVKLVKGFNLQSILCVGGTNINSQAMLIRRPFNFLIGTPGRIIDLYERKWLFLDRFQNVVLDEADRMVDMGFINDMRFILGKLPKQRQSMFFTATLDAPVEELIRQFLNSPVKVSVKKRDTSANIEQDIIRVPNDKKMKEKILIDLLSKPEFDKVLVFVRTKFGADKVCRALVQSGIKADAIHGNKSQNYRNRSLKRFKSGEIHVLVATDVAARGLDINNVSHVINFDIPATYDDYVHRIGRTGRADKKGVALTFVG